MKPLGRLTQRQLAERDEIRLIEEILQRPLGLVGNIDLPGGEPHDQLIGRDVDQLDLVRHFQHGVGQALADDDVGDLGDHVVEAFDVLDIERGPNIDARVQQLLDVLPPLCMARARRVGVGQLVDQDQPWPARKCGVEVELPERHATVRNVSRGKRFESVQQRFRFRPAMWLDITDHDLGARLALPASGGEHGVCLAHPSGVAEEYPQPSPLRG